MVKDRYFIKIVPSAGNVIHRLEVHRRHIFSGLGALGLILIGALGLHLVQLHQARTQLDALQALTAAQQNQLQHIDKQAADLQTQLQAVQTQNRQIQRVMGINVGGAHGHAKREKMARLGSRPGFSSQATVVQSKLDELTRDSSDTLQQAIRLQRLTMRILNMRHIEAIARDRMIAAIPSIDPVDGAQVVGCFCYRTSPDVGFHQGVDLGADYGQVVRATAAGTIASADWDGGFGQKIDVDHGNGYHTWYAHLSRMDVHAGDHVVKGQPIGLVGSTGFSTGPHLHYQVMLNNSPIDPTPFLTGVPQKVLASLP